MIKTDHVTKIILPFCWSATNNGKEWQLTVQLWKEAALGRTTVTETEDPGALPVIMEHLCKIAEAAWVMWVSGEVSFMGHG
jgi:hypothetical protein